MFENYRAIYIIGLQHKQSPQSKQTNFLHLSHMGKLDADYFFLQSLQWYIG
jgi:hypothetical protein